jgi:hypothetical protein
VVTFLHLTGPMGLARCAALALLLFGILATTAAAQSDPAVDDAQQVVDRFELARGAGDVDTALAQLGDAAVVTVQNQTSTRSFTGSVQLRSYLQNIGTHFQTLMRSRPAVLGNTVRWTERDQVDGQPLDATVVAVVSAGHIVSLTYRDSDVAGSPGRLAALNPRQQPTQLPNAAWAGGLGILGLAMLGFVFSWPRRKGSRSKLDGRLLLALREEFEDRGKQAA